MLLEQNSEQPGDPSRMPQELLRLIGCIMRRPARTADTLQPQAADLLFRRHDTTTRIYSYTQALSVDCPGGYLALYLASDSYIPNRCDELIYKAILQCSNRIIHDDTVSYGTTLPNLTTYINNTDKLSHISAEMIRESIL